MSRQWMLPDGSVLHDASARQYQLPVGEVDETTPTVVVVPQLYAAEIGAGPPMRGSPWLRRLPVAPLPGPPAPVLVPPRQIYAAEVSGGPPARGAPWQEHLPIQQLPGPPAPLLQVRQIYAAEISGGPPLRTAPWLEHLPIQPLPGPPTPCHATAALSFAVMTVAASGTFVAPHFVVAVAPLVLAPMTTAMAGSAIGPNRNGDAAVTLGALGISALARTTSAPPTPGTQPATGHVYRPFREDEPCEEHAREDEPCEDDRPRPDEASL